ncbi:MAG TPA: glycosyltransferase family 4 protein [Solirubrobacteraceae bacterium]|jgi:glycosyltransferase involved in cell wall biosynthesis|nr:glycosyltransferase family 4 protein [Solirubrobacteraceae bacterium]
MRIAMLHSDLPPDSGGAGGVRHQVARLGEALVSRGHDVIAYVVVPEHEPVDFEVRMAQLGGMCARGRLARLALTPVAFAMGNYSECDIVHAHGDSQLLFRRGPRVVRTFYGSARDEARHAQRLKQRAIERYQHVGERVARRLADRTVGISRATEQAVGPLDEIIPCGVDRRRFRPGPKSEHPTVVFIGTMRGRKRGDLACEIFRTQVRPRVPDAEMIVIAPDVREEPEITVVRSASDDTVAEYLRRAWVFTLPSTYEGFGVPYIEAMASGTAVVATPNAGAHELFVDGEGGVLMRDAQLGDAICELLLDQRRRETLAAGGHRASERFDWLQVAARYEHLYTELLVA